MRINFDQLPHNHNPQAISTTTPKTIQIEIQSPFYERIVKPISPRNYKEELSEIKNEMTMPDSITKFLEKEIESEIKDEKKEDEINTSTFIIDKVEKLEHQMKAKKLAKEKRNAKKKINWVFNYKKHQCNNHISRELQKQINDKQETTLQPKLTQSKVSKNLWGKKLQSYAKCSSKRYSVYEHLYMESRRRQMKKEVKDQKEAEEERIEKKKEKSKNYVSIYNRLDGLVKQQNRRKNEKVSHDLNTGREFFKPDLTRSKCSYKHFAQSLSKLSATKHSVEKEVQKNEVHKKLHHEQYKINYLDESVIDCLVEEFYPQNKLNFEGIKKLHKQELMILKPFLQNMEHLQAQINDQQTTISSKKDEKTEEKAVVEQSIFRSKLIKFYKSINLYDRETLRKRFTKKKERNIDRCEHRYHPLVNIRSCSLDELSRGHQKHVFYV